MVLWKSLCTDCMSCNSESDTEELCHPALPWG